jgi:hypothetical protein
MRQLEQMLARGESAWLFTPAEMEMKHLIVRTHGAVFIAMHLLFTFLLLVVSVFNKQIEAAGGYLSVSAMMCVVTVGLTLNMRAQEKKKNEVRDSWYLHTTEGREELRKELEGLKGKIVSMRAGK